VTGGGFVLVEKKEKRESRVLNAKGIFSYEGTAFSEWKERTRRSSVVNL